MSEARPQGPSPSPNFRPGRAVLIAAAYIAFGGLWILFSDRWLLAIAGDLSTLSALSQGKGLAFVLATGVLVYFLAARAQRGSAQSQSLLPPHLGRLTLFYVFAFLVAAVILASLLLVARSAQEARNQRVEQLRQVAGLKARALSEWLDQGHAAGRRLLDQPLLLAALEPWRRQPNAHHRQALLDTLAQLRLATPFTQAFLVDAQGQVLLGAPGDSLTASTEMLAALRSALDQQQPRSAGLSLAAAGQAYQLLVPLPQRMFKEGGRPCCCKRRRCTPCCPGCWRAPRRGPSLRSTC